VHVKKTIKSLQKRARKGFCGYPVATIAHYGPDDKKATKVVVSIVAHEDAEPEPIKKWFSVADVRNDENILREIKEFLSSHGAASVVMPDRVIGCPHEEGIDYPTDEECPQCPFWKGRDRWTGRKLH
jgi:predicted Zn-ribbon and HTH transcriptional regulator